MTLRCTVPGALRCTVFSDLRGNVLGDLRGPVVGALCGGLIVSTLACRRAASGERSPYARNLLLITIDTLRADHVGAYGYTRARTPVLDSVARGILFEHAFA